MPFHHKLLLVLVLSAAFSASAAYAVHEFNTRCSDETSAILRSCGINPVNGAWLHEGAK